MSDNSAEELGEADAQGSIPLGFFNNDNEETESLARIRAGGLRNISLRLNSNKRLVLAAVRRNGLDLALASEDLQNDRQVVLVAVRQNGLALQYASRELREDPEIILAAVRQNGLALQYASNSFFHTSDRYAEIALAAVQNNWESFEYVNRFYQGEYEIALAAVVQNARAIYSVSPRLFGNQEFTSRCYEISFGAYYHIYQSMLSLARISYLSAELNNRLQETLIELASLNIEFNERFIAATSSEVEGIINNRKIIESDELFVDNRPVALVILPKTDRTGSFLHNNMTDLIRRGYNVVYFEAASDLEVYEAIELVGQRSSISLLYLGGHGTPATTRLSGQPGENDESLFLDHSDEAEMYHLNNYMAENSQILLYSCRACNGELQMMLERVFYDSTFFVPVGTPRGFEFIFDEQNTLLDVNFFTS